MLKMSKEHSNLSEACYCTREISPASLCFIKCCFPWAVPLKDSLTRFLFRLYKCSQISFEVFSYTNCCLPNWSVSSVVITVEEAIEGKWNAYKKWKIWETWWLEQLWDMKCLRLTVALHSGLLCAVLSVSIAHCLHAINVTYIAEMNEGCYTGFIHY